MGIQARANRRTSPLATFCVLTGLATFGACRGDGAISDRGAAPARWALDPTPILSIGQLEGSEDQLLSAVRDVELLDGDAVLVADGGSYSVRVYGLSGELRSRFGAEGQGPGEFSAIWAAWLRAPDSVAVLDLNSERLSLFHLDGELIDDRHLTPGEGGGDMFEGGFSDGSFVVSRLAYPETFQDGIGIGRMPHNLITPEGVPGGQLAETDGAMFYRPETTSVSNPGGGAARHPLSPKPRGLVASDTFYIGLSLDSKVQLYTENGSFVREIQLDMPRLSPSEALRLLDSARVGGDRSIRAGPVPDVKRIPAFMGLLVDDRGRIWAREYRPETDSPWIRESGPGFTRNYGGTWWIFTAGGMPIGRLTVPDGFQLEDVDGSLIAGIEVDAVGLERVRVYRIIGG